MSGLTFFNFLPPAQQSKVRAHLALQYVMTATLHSAVRISSKWPPVIPCGYAQAYLPLGQHLDLLFGFSTLSTEGDLNLVYNALLQSMRTAGIAFTPAVLAGWLVASVLDKLRSQCYCTIHTCMQQYLCRKSGVHQLAIKLSLCLVMRAQGDSC